MSTLPLVGFHFLVQFGDGKVFDDISFTKVDGIEFKYKVETISQGSGPTFTPSYSYDFADLVLERGKTSKKSLLFKWLQIQITGQKILPIPIFILVKNDNGKTILTWSFFGAFPISFTTSGIDANSKDVMLEKITFKYTKFEFKEEVHKPKPKPKPKPKQKKPGPVQLKTDKDANAKNALRMLRKMDGYLQKKPLKITPPGEKSSRLNRRTSGKKPPK